ncbi:hypothetical protein CAOG_01234 [Capsaspora owczarzaki ATCC 30864]|uniref:Renin receptor-like C-terminal transmembrane spanning segment domain-containing protein n=1 Tax=Capsaspora owczarzaki (strain ATCC 30864) TaxID=595528 RepID=A0A0D2X0X4_CAPO3|nr:hypothetical protein CAOG_01234 [Capsaspora owczarzaki ATCC 30864]KJE89814.1 hypothetical protein CAOG_001234 [Capsaspora owczarzaki ATCC 30864]|eukprot:XP_004349754.1 hypothetical protein CAOG_01234 [Capsaspora owczarzaki ATCC 30864]
MRAALSLVLVALVATLAASAKPQLFHDRSGDVVVFPVNHDSARHSKLVIANSPAGVKFSAFTGDETLRLRQVAPLLSAAMQIPMPVIADDVFPVRPNAAKALEAALPETDFLHRPSANVLIVVQNAASDISLEAETVFPVQHRVGNPLVSLMTALTGARPGQHGIIGSAWMNKNREVSAFSSAYSGSTHSSILDTFTQVFNESLTLSVSADAQMAAAANVHAALAKTDAQKSNRVVLSNVTPSLRLAAALAGVESTPETLTVTLANGQTVKFTAADSEMVALVAELNLFYSALAYLNARNSFEPEMATFVLSSMSGVRAAYSEERLAAAVALVNQFIASFSASASARYGGNALVEVLLLDTAPLAISTENLDALLDAVKPHLPKAVADTFASLFPNVYTKESAQEAACAALKSTVANRELPFAVRCRSDVVASATASRRDVAAATTTDIWPEMFNIILWLFLLLAIALVLVVYSLMYLDPGYDSVIYRMTNTRPKSD